jgi:hypothetical protein
LRTRGAGGFAPCTPTKTLFEKRVLESQKLWTAENCVFGEGFLRKNEKAFLLRIGRRKAFLLFAFVLPKSKISAIQSS